MRALVVAGLVTGGCFTAPTPALPSSSNPSVGPAPSVAHDPPPSVRIAALFFADHPDDVDTQSLEGWPELAYTGFPAVSLDGTQVAVVEERDGWGHVSVPGLRILGGAQEQWFPLVPPGPRPASEADEQAMRSTFDALVARANSALRSTSWRSLEPPPAPVRVDIGPDRTASYAIGRHTLVLRFTNVDEPVNAPKPPSELVVLDHKRRELIALRDLHATWTLSTCGLSYFELIGVNERPGIALFQSQLGMTSHACDGKPQPVAFKVVRF